MLFEILDLAESGPGVRIFIGSENKLFSLSGSSLIVAPYRDGEDRIVGLRTPGERVVVHSIGCIELASGIDADWLDLSWGKQSRGAVGRMRVTLYDRPGTLAEMSGILAANSANITNLRLSNREGGFHTYDVVVEVRDVHHVMRILSALRASDIACSLT